MKILNKIWEFLAGIGESVAAARQAQADYYIKNSRHGGWE
jgi:hypothetical protein